LNKKFREINVEYTINSGQVFLWNKIGKKWYGVDGENILVIDEKTTKFSKNQKEFNFFRENDNFEEIFSYLKKDKIVKKALNIFPGLRLLQQDPFQCYISFIVSSNSNIPNIKTRLQNLCKKFGERKIINANEFFVFPKSSIISKAPISKILDCGVGYRAKAIKEASIAVTNGDIDFENLKNMNYYDAKQELVKVFGIGNKVADCILLFSLNKLEAFPLDRWMIRILQKYYSNKFQTTSKTMTDKTYLNIHQNIVEHFGKYAGYSQQFLFKMERESNNKKWL
jgi:N-glycosylase/DNA lyase